MRPRCIKCGDLIPVARLEVIPETATCVDCSDVAAYNEATIELAGTDPGELINQVQYPDRG